MPASRSVRASYVVTSLSAEQHPAAGRAPRAGEHLDELALPVALDAGDAEDLALAQLERHALQRRHAAVGAGRQVLDLERRPRPGLAGFLSTRSRTSRPTISGRDLLLVRVLGDQVADHLAAPHHRDAVGDLEHLAAACG